MKYNGLLFIGKCITANAPVMGVEGGGGLTNFSFHVSRKMLMPHSRFSKFYVTALHHLSVPDFSKSVNILDFQK